MTQPFYNYGSRDGIKNITWNDFFGLCKGLALAVSADPPEMILGIICGGAAVAFSARGCVCDPADPPSV